MSYKINKTNGDELVELFDGTTNTDTGLTLIGRNYISYGEIQNENFIRLLENFADTIPPGQSVGFTPIAGQLWWDTGALRLKVYDDNTGEFIPVSEQTSSSTEPTIKQTGDQWWDISTQQLKIYTGTGWQLIGPIYTQAQGVSGEVVSTITDTHSVSHLVVNQYVGGNLVAIVSADTEFAPDPIISGFGNISPGINLKSTEILNSTANNAVRVGGLYANVLARTDVNTTFTNDVFVEGTLVLTDANVYFDNKSLVLQNKNSNGNVEVYINSTVNGNVKALMVDGDTGLTYVYDDPINNTGVATKRYVDVVNSALTGIVGTQIAEINGNVEQLSQDVYANIGYNINWLNANLDSVHSYIDANVTALSNSTDFRFADATANAAAQSVQIDNLVADVALKAYIHNPSFTGTVTAPNVAANNNSNVVATTAYVDGSAATMRSDYISRVTAAETMANVQLAAGLALKANIAGPIFTGEPKADTPATGDNSTRLATTAFVNTAITNKQFNYTVASTAAGDLNGLISSTNSGAGNDGDFWFQIG
jgi:hypothetical protein